MAKQTTSKLSQAQKNVRSTTKTSSGEKRMSNTPSKDRRKVFTKGGSAGDFSYIKVEKKTNAINSRGLVNPKPTASKKIVKK